MRRLRAQPQTGPDAELAQLLLQATRGAEPAADLRRRLLLAASRLESEQAWEREALYYRAQRWPGMQLVGASPLFGWMTLPLRHAFLLGFPKLHFSW